MSIDQELSEDLNSELEALGFTYPTLHIDRTQGPGVLCTLTNAIEPFTGGDSSATFVLCTLVLTVYTGYPEVLPSISLKDVKGLGDSRQLQLATLLQKEAAELTGVLMLGHLIETATNFLTEHNTPDGSCAFCLEPMHAASPAFSQLVKIPCFHAYHNACFCDWWAWQQHDVWKQEQELVQHTGAQAALMSDKIPLKEDPPYQELYTTQCPVCRAPCPLSQLSHVISDLKQALARLKASRSGAPAKQLAQPGDGPAGAVPGAVQPSSQLAAMQKRHQQLFQKQQASGGIITLSITTTLPSSAPPPAAPDTQEPAGSSSASSTNTTAAASSASSARVGSGPRDEGPRSGCGRGRGRQAPKFAGQGGRGQDRDAQGKASGLNAGGSGAGRGRGRGGTGRGRSGIAGPAQPGTAG